MKNLLRSAWRLALAGNQVQINLLINEYMNRSKFVLLILIHFIVKISNSHHSGHVYSHQSSTTTMNHSINHLLPFTIPHTCAAVENFAVGPRVRSPAVNSSLSTESDRFSGQASSHPSSFQPIYPSVSACISHRSLLPQTTQQTSEQLWIGYDEGPITPMETSNHLGATQESGNGPAVASASLESLIEPPESFKNHSPSSSLLMNSVPPQMAQLRRLEKSCNGNGGWSWQEGQYIDH